MSTIFLPYVYHQSIDHKFYVAMTTSQRKIKDSAMFNTGIRLPYDDEYNTAILDLLDLILLYDTCYIPVDDMVYLFCVIGPKASKKLVDSGAIKLFDSFSNKLAVYYLDNKQMVFSNIQDQSQKAIKERVKAIGKNKFFLDSFKDYYIPSLVKFFLSAYYVNDIRHLNTVVAEKTAADLLNNEVRKIVELSKEESTEKLDYKQIKDNRVLHYHFYNELANLIQCDYIFVPIELEGLYAYYKANSPSKNDLEKIYDSIKRFENIPDIKEMFKEGKLTIDDILEIRNNKHGVKFRKWLSNIYSKDEYNDSDFDKLYFNACTGTSELKKKFDRLPTKLFRTIAFKVVSKGQPGLGIGLSVVDTLISKSLDPYNPQSYTRDRLKKYLAKMESEQSNE